MDGQRVVLVDDLPDLRRLLVLWLEQANVEVVGEAADAEEALDVVERERPDVVIMDMHMPGRSGAECTRDIVARFPGIAVIGFTSAREEETFAALREAGAVATFHKSELSELVAYLRAQARVAAGGQEG
jgi:DNA-binding NarL/FixJ family response regulator